MPSAMEELCCFVEHFLCVRKLFGGFISGAQWSDLRKRWGASLLTGLCSLRRKLLSLGAHVHTYIHSKMAAKRAMGTHLITDRPEVQLRRLTSSSGLDGQLRRL